MKHFLSKVKKATKDFFTNKSAFSLVELIVVIAIMAVMAAVLAPSLLGYVERSRAQKDDSAMGEVINGIQLSLADQNVYDEMSQYTVKGNFSCYADGDTVTNVDANKVSIKEPSYWLYNDNARLLDETAYVPAGSMRGVTVTLKPSGSAEYILKDGIVNQIGDDSTKKGNNAGAVLANCPELYNRLRSTVGDTIKVSSQTYRNSTYTIFISMGTTGGNEAAMQDAIKVWGQYNGTNLPEVMTAIGSGSQTGGAGSDGQQGGSGGAPAVTLPAKGKTLAEYTWAEVQQIIQAGKTGEYNFKVGDLTRTFTINNQTDKQARIVDIDSNKVTFMLTSSIGNHNINSATVEYEWGHNLGGYAESEVKTWIDTTVYPSIDNDLKSVISKTTITCSGGLDNPSITKTAECHLYLLSLKEMGLNDKVNDSLAFKPIIETEGETLDWFLNEQYFPNGVWTRSTCPINFTCYVCEPSSPTAMYISANPPRFEYAIYPAFVIS